MKIISVENQLEETLISYRKVYYHVLGWKVPVDQFVVSRCLINAVKASRSRYRSSLQKEKDDETQKAREKEDERKRIREEIIQKQEQQKRLKKDSETLEKEINFLKQRKLSDEPSLSSKCGIESMRNFLLLLLGPVMTSSILLVMLEL